MGKQLSSQPQVNIALLNQSAVLVDSQINFWTFAFGLVSVFYFWSYFYFWGLRGTLNFGY